MKRYMQSKSLIICLAIPCFSGLANAYEYEYGKIPTHSTLCSSTGLVGGISGEGYGGALLDGEAGGGWHVALHADIQGKFNAGVTVNPKIESSVYLRSNNCVTVVDTKADLGFDDLDAQQANFLTGILADINGQAIDESELALGLITNANALVANLSASRATLDNFEVVNQAVSGAITGVNPIDLQGAWTNLQRVAENTGDLLNPKLKRALMDPNQLVSNHLRNLDVIRSSCTDISSGNIEHLPPELLEEISSICSVAIDTQLAFEGFLGGVIGSIESGGEAVSDIAGIAANGQTVTAITDSIDNSINEVSLTAQTLGDAVNGLGETVGQTGKLLEASLNAGGSIITNSFSSLSATTTEIGSVLSDSSSSSSGGLQLLEGEVSRTLELIDGLSLSAVAELPGKIAKEAAAAVSALSAQACDAEINVDLGLVSLSRKVRDLPVIDKILGC